MMGGMDHAEIELKRKRDRERQREYRARNRERVRERDRKAKAKVRKADPGRYNESMRRWREANPERYRAQMRAAGARWRDSNRERYRATNRERGRVWAAANPERRREISLRHQLKEYGLTPAGYDSLVAAHSGRCAICGTTSPGRKGSGRLLIDHCHATGIVRGLLCNPCNTMLGNARDSPERLRAAAAYIERFAKNSARTSEDQCQPS